MENFNPFATVEPGQPGKSQLNIFNSEFCTKRCPCLNESVPGILVVESLQQPQHIGELAPAVRWHLRQKLHSQLPGLRCIDEAVAGDGAWRHLFCQIARSSLGFFIKIQSRFHLVKFGLRCRCGNHFYEQLLCLFIVFTKPLAEAKGLCCPS